MNLVAKSYANWEQIGEVIISSGKKYINVKHPKTGNLKQVRVYSEVEYKKMYPDITASSGSVQDTYFKPQKDVLGFQKGYITIFKGDTYKNLEWFQQSIARYTRLWGWYIISTEEIPADLPEDVTPVQLPWEMVGNEDGKVKPEAEVKMAVESLIYDEGTSEFIGEIGERLDLELTVDRVIELDGNYGRSNMHIMSDDCGNVFVWTTASKFWEVGSEKKLRGTVKDHRTYKGVKQTILTRCAECK
jgi:hypothetical protein